MLWKGFVRNRDNNLGVWVDESVRLFKILQCNFHDYTELLYKPVGIGCKENDRHSETYAMNTLFDTAEVLDTKKEIQEEDVSYEHAGYQIRVYFHGEKTLTQCIQNLAERKIMG